MMIFRYVKFYPATRPTCPTVGKFTFSFDENDFTKQSYLSFDIRVDQYKFEKNSNGEWEKFLHFNSFYNKAANEYTLPITIKCQVGRVSEPQPGLEEENIESDTSVIETIAKPQAPQASASNGAIPVIASTEELVNEEFVMVDQGEDYVDAVEAVESEAVSETGTMNHNKGQTPVESKVETDWSDDDEDIRADRSAFSEGESIEILDEKTNPEPVPVVNADENDKTNFQFLDEVQEEIKNNDLKKEILELVHQILPDDMKFHSTDLFDSAGAPDEREEFFDALFAATDLNTFFGIMNCADKLKAGDLKDKIVKQFIIKQSSKELLKSAAWQEMKNHKQLFEETVEKVLPLVLKNEKIVF